MALTCRDGIKIPFDDLVAEINGKLDDIGYGQPRQVLATNDFRTGYVWKTYDLNCKVDKVTGKDLSTNDLTNDMVEIINAVNRNIHSHNNKIVLDGLGQDPMCGELMYNGELVNKDSTMNDLVTRYQYCADPLFNRILIVDPANMKFVGWTEGTIDANVSSVSPAGKSNRMYISTDLNAYDVIDAETRMRVGSIHLPDPDDAGNESVGLVPSGCGSYNEYNNLQIISHKDEPFVTLINTKTDRPAALAVGTKISTETIDANTTTGATGASTWLDADHFSLLDRYRNEIRIYKVKEDTGISGEFTTTLTDTVSLPMSAIVMDAKIQNQDRNKTVFWILVEGSSSQGVAPQLIEYTYIPGSGELIETVMTTFPNVLNTDQVSSYGYWPKYGELWIPTWSAKKTFVVDVNGGASNMLVINGDGYDTGLGGSEVLFSDILDLAIIINKFDKEIQIISRVGTVYTVDVSQPADVSTPVIGTLRQSDGNRISADGLFLYLFSVQDGIFIEISLEFKTISRILYVGGNPTQTNS